MDLAGASNCLHAWNPDIDGSFGAPADANVVCVQCSCGICGYPLPIEALSQAKLVMKRVEIKTQQIF